jgi:hypothetical protein
VYTRVFVRQLVGANRTYKTSFPQAFSFVWTKGSWGLADDLFREEKANEAAQALKPSSGTNG